MPEILKGVRRKQVSWSEPAFLILHSCKARTGGGGRYSLLEADFTPSVLWLLLGSICCQHSFASHFFTEMRTNLEAWVLSKYKLRAYGISFSPPVKIRLSPTFISLTSKNGRRTSLMAARENSVTLGHGIKIRCRGRILDTLIAQRPRSRVVANLRKFKYPQ